MTDEAKPDDSTGSDSSRCSDVGDLDFVFHDGKGDYYRVRKHDDVYWIHWLHHERQWVSLRKVRDLAELICMQNACVHWNRHSEFELGVPFDKSKWPHADSPDVDHYRVSAPFGTFYKCEKCGDMTNTNENHVCG